MRVLRLVGDAWCVVSWSSLVRSSLARCGAGNGWVELPVEEAVVLPGLFRWGQFGIFCQQVPTTRGRKITEGT